MVEKSGALFGGVGQDWRRFYDALRASTRILVVDDEPLVYEVVEAILDGAGFKVEVAETAEDAWALIQCNDYGLLVTDKNLPGMSGVDLVAKIKSAGLDLPSLVITGYASVESISNALAAGASDYVTKPFDNIEHVRKRATSIIERNLLIKLYERIVADLTASVMESGAQSESVQRIGRELFAFKKSLGERPDLLYVDVDSGSKPELVDFLEAAGHSVCVEHDKDAAIACLSEPDGPLAALVSLQLRFPVALVADLRHWDPLLHVIVTSKSPNLADALAAVEAGASDFFIQSVERLEALEVRVRRAVETSRRARLYLQLIGILQREAIEQGQRVVTDILDLLPEDHREYLQRVANPLEGELPEIEVDLTDLFEDGMDAGGSERRKHRRSAANDVEIWYRQAGTNAVFARGWLRDISRGGFFMQSDPTLLRGTKVEVHLLMAGDPPGSAVELLGWVVRTEVHNPDPDNLSGCGVLVSEVDQSKLDPIIARLDNC